MAARRLIAVMLVLLFLSSLAAALAPVDERLRTEETTTEEPLPEPETEEGELLRHSLDADAERPRTIRASVGDQLQLRVTARRVGTIELAGLGADEDVGPDAPALFDVLLDRQGRFPVRERESGRRVGVIEVGAASALKAPTERPERPAPDRS